MRRAAYADRRLLVVYIIKVFDAFQRGCDVTHVRRPHEELEADKIAKEAQFIALILMSVFDTMGDLRQANGCMIERHRIRWSRGRDWIGRAGGQDRSGGKDGEILAVSHLVCDDCQARITNLGIERW